MCGERELPLARASGRARKGRAACASRSRLALRRACTVSRQRRRESRTKPSVLKLAARTMVRWVRLLDVGKGDEAGQSRACAGEEKGEEKTHVSPFEGGRRGPL